MSITDTNNIGNMQQNGDFPLGRNQGSDGKNTDPAAGVNAADTKVRELEGRIAELEYSWKRALADYKNFEKRTAEERLTLVSLANLVLIESLLPILDNLESLDCHLSDDGLKLIVKSFRQTLEKAGLKEIDTQDKTFDPSTMEAVDTVEGEKNKVVTVVLKGYLLGDKLVRPARVKVGKGS